MKDDIIFHVVPQQQWKEKSHAGLYKPDTLEEEGFIHCSSGKQVEETANRLFKGQRKIYLLVIDVSTVEPRVTWEKPDDKDVEYPHIYGPLNTDAILDRITLHPNKEGYFEINVESN